ncbi:cell division protein SepF [Actinotignum timonense]|uniref:cell division protein SepF n=2 Tax=Actinotignum TaxID=1653174 RepID=UPI00254EB10A|nr:cell division protein SepF [Actinotignum timonense]MDK6906595.1 cell division protein SepF [Actinotignum timonense]MDY5139320.1 cell division protein SepF [Actinotignum timonense]
MGMFQRFVSKATLNDDEYLDYQDDADYYEDDYEAEVESPVSEIHAVEQPVDIARIITAKPRSFTEVRGFAEQFRDGLPVIINLAEADDVARNRIVDFATGICFGLHGDLNKISADVLLMTPRTVRMENQRPESRDSF